MLRTIETHTYKITAFVVAFGLVSFLFSTSARAQTKAAKPPALASADWSVKSTHSLASNPPSADVVQTFVNAAFGSDYAPSVCAFRFVDLRHSGNLSLVTVLNSGWYLCNGLDIFDKTASGFEHYSTDAHTKEAGEPNQDFSSEDLADSIQDVNHDGNFVLVLFGAIGSSETNMPMDRLAHDLWVERQYLQRCQQSVQRILREVSEVFAGEDGRRMVERRRGTGYR